jgi:protein phosphatase
VEESTPASRASALHSPRPPAPDTPEDDAAERPHRHPVRTVVLLVVLLGLLAGGTWGGWTWTQRQYYVGATPEGFVAVYRGVPGQIAGLRLSRLDHTENTKLDDLTKVAQDRVKQGISASSLTEAEQKYHDLVNPANGNTVGKPGCPPSLPSTTPDSTPPTGANPAISTSPSSASPTRSAPTAGVSASGGSPSSSASPTASPSQSPC